MIHKTMRTSKPHITASVKLMGVHYYYFSLWKQKNNNYSLNSSYNSLKSAQCMKQLECQKILSTSFALLCFYSRLCKYFYTRVHISYSSQTSYFRVKFLIVIFLFCFVLKLLRTLNDQFLPLEISFYHKIHVNDTFEILLEILGDQNWNKHINKLVWLIFFLNLNSIYCQSENYLTIRTNLKCKILSKIPFFSNHDYN